MKSPTQQSFPFLGILTLIFITLKLCNVIAWSWWAVLSPIWGMIALMLVLVIGACAVAAWKEAKDEVERGV